MPDTDYFEKLQAILGFDPSSEEMSLNLSWDNRQEAKAALEKIRSMQRDLKLLKKQVSADAALVKSEYATAKASVGTGIGSALGGAIFGRRLVGKTNVLERDRLRRASLSAQEPFNALKSFIDDCVLKLDAAKAQVLASPSYQITEKDDPVEITKEPIQMFYVYLEGSVKGPFTKDQILALAQVGSVDPFTQICIAGSETWIPFHSCKEAQ